MRLSWPIVLAIVLGLAAVQFGQSNKGAPWIRKRIIIVRTKPTPSRQKLPAFTTIPRFQSQVGVNPSAGDIKHHHKLEGEDNLFEPRSLDQRELITIEEICEEEFRKRQQTRNKGTRNRCENRWTKGNLRTYN